MTETRDEIIEEEPLGIVISRGSREQETPRFSAFVWSQAPEPGGSPARGAKAA